MISFPEVSLAPATALAVERLANLFNEAFADYLIRFPAMTPEFFQRFLNTQGIDLEHSRLALLGDQPVGFAFIHAEGDLCRLAGMGVVPTARRRGAASLLLDAVMQEASERGDRLMTLEVFEQNSRALDLYRSRGFQTLGRLYGWTREAVSTRSLPAPSDLAPPLEPVSVTDFATSLAHNATPCHGVPNPLNNVDALLGNSLEAFRFPHLPWQISMLAVRRLPASIRVFRAGDTLAIVAETDPGTLRWCTLLPLREWEEPWPQMRSTAARVLREFPTHRWMVPAIFPELYGTQVFGPLGFLREPLNQWHMHRPF